MCWLSFDLFSLMVLAGVYPQSSLAKKSGQLSRLGRWQSQRLTRKCQQSRQHCRLDSAFGPIHSRAALHGPGTAVPTPKSSLRPLRFEKAP
ncbi:hypothetical protein DFJ73DRAFT_848670 [Zopfochytrium polystomum]|nr:hypothetical protein DFJ73DRAFT_848670 [Zopfochytrium polystomum]